MELFAIVLQSVLILISIGLLGFWIIKRGIIPENVISFLSRLAVDIALPCVIFSNIILKFNPEQIHGWWQLPLWWMLFQTTSFLLVMLTSFISQKDARSEFRLSLFFQNGLFFPLIMITGIFGPGSSYAIMLFIFIIFHPVLFFATANLFFRKKENAKKTELNWARIINPVLLATFLAVTIRLIGGHEYIPSFLLTVLSMLGAMSFPLVMIILGGSLYIDFQKKGEIYFTQILKFVALKNFVFPLVFIYLLNLVRPDYGLALIIFLQSAMPPMTGTSIHAERIGGNASIANQFILASFAVSIVSIPLMFMLFSKFFPAP
jgi:malate permease and related proteins